MEVKVCLVGDKAVGKTSLVQRYLGDELDDEYLHTVEAKVCEPEILLPMELRHETLRVDMTLWDVLGDTPLDESSGAHYLNCAQGLLVICDITRRSTVDSLGEWNAVISPTLRDLPAHVIVSKSDLANDVEVGVDEVFRLGETFSSPVMVTSASTGSNVKRAFESFVKGIVERELGPDADFLVEQRFGSSSAMSDWKSFKRTNTHSRMWKASWSLGPRRHCGIWETASSFSVRFS